MPLLRGRPFTDVDVEQARQVAVISQSMAKLYWPVNEDPLGSRINLAFLGRSFPNVSKPPSGGGWCEVVGIVRDIRNRGLEQPSEPAAYVPYTLLVPSEAGLSVRTASNPLLLSNTIRSTIASAGNGQPATEVWRYSDYLEAFAFSHNRFSAVLFLLFGILGLALAASGIYSVVSYVVSRRTHEIGIRMALGAQKHQVLWMVLRETMVLVVIGVGLGFVGAAAVARFIANQLFQNPPS